MPSVARQSVGGPTLCYRIRARARTSFHEARCTMFVARTRARFSLVSLVTSFESPVTSYRFPGDHTAGVTPVPIPNTVVKPRRADVTAPFAGWESRSSPGLKSKTAGFHPPPFLFYPRHACLPAKPGKLRTKAEVLSAAKDQSSPQRMKPCPNLQRPIGTLTMWSRTPLLNKWTASWTPSLTRWKRKASIAAAASTPSAAATTAGRKPRRVSRPTARRPVHVARFPGPPHNVPPMRPDAFRPRTRRPHCPDPSGHQQFVPYPEG